MIVVKIAVVVVVVATIIIVAIYLFRIRPPVSSHLKPYFKNSAELDAFVKKRRLLDAKRREQLTHPANAKESAEYLSLNDYNIADTTF